MRLLPILGSLFLLPLSPAAAAEPVNKTDAVNASKPVPPATLRSFGIAPAGLTSPEQEAAVRAMDAASVLPGQKNTITRMIWSTESVPKLIQVWLWGPKVDDALVAQMIQTPDLSTVCLHEPHITDEAMKALAKLPKLRLLAIRPMERYVKAGFPPLMYCFPDLAPRTDRPRVTGKGIALLAGAPALEELDLFDTVIASDDLGVLPAFPKLERLSLPLEVDEKIVSQLQACKRLRSLTLGYRTVGADEIEKLVAVKNLTSLTCTHATLSDAALEALAKLENLQQLELSDCGLSDARLAHLKLPPKLTSLSLKQNDISGPGLAHLVGSGVKNLNLRYTDLDDQTIGHLTQLVSVHDLQLEHCAKITDAGIRSGVFQGMKTLKHLNFRDQRKITDACLDDLAKLGHLQSLSVRAVAITNAGVERLKKEMPNTYVFR